MEKKNMFNMHQVVGSKRKAPQSINLSQSQGALLGRFSSLSQSQGAHLDQYSNLFQSESIPQSSLPKRECKTSRSYITCSRDMDIALGVVLMDQMAQGNKCDADGWKSQAYQAAVDYVNNSLGMKLTKENIKNRLKAWKRYYSIVRDIQVAKSGFHWDEDRRMIIITSDNQAAWNAYVEANPDAKSMANKEIHNWPEIAMLCGRDRATGEGVETFDEGAEAMADEEISTHSIQSSKGKGIPSTSSARKVQEPTKKTKKDALANAVQEVAATVKQYFESKKKKEDTRPTAMMIYEVVSKVEGLTENEIFRATQRLMHDNIEEFDLLQGLPHDQKKKWIRFLLNN